MTPGERRGWVVVGSLFTTLFFVFGSGFNTAGVFVTPLIREFAWTRTQVSLLQTTLALAAGVATPLVGLLLDRREARAVIATGAALTGVGFVLASRAVDLTTLVLGYALVGAGLAAATLLPCSLVVAHWFGARRGLALGLTMAGTSTGGMVMTMVASRVISTVGWRAAYIALALPMVVIVVPLVVATVRTRPHAQRDARIEAPPVVLRGPDVGAALRERSFWFIAIGQFCYAFASTGTNLHGIPHLIGIGYPAARAAQMFGLVFGLAAAGKLAMGLLADRLGARRALVVNLVLMAGGIICLGSAASVPVAAGFVVVYGLTVGAPLTLGPMLVAESLGLRRFGSLSGLAGIFNVAGAASGPLVAGRLFDASGSYAGGFALFVLALLVAAAATFGCVPLAEDSALDRVPAARRHR